MRSNQWCLAETFNEIANLLLRQNTVEGINKVTHGSMAAAPNHIIDSLDMVQVKFLGSSLHMGLILQITGRKDITEI